MEQNDEIKTAVQPEAEEKAAETVNTQTETVTESKPEEKTKKPKFHRSFTQHDALFAWISCFCGYLFCLAFPLSEASVGGFLFTVFIFTATGIVLALKKIKPNGTAIFAAVTAVAISASLIFSRDSYTNIFAGGYAFVAYCYFVYSATVNNLGKPFSSMIVFDIIKASLFMPFSALKDFTLFRAIAASRKSKGTKYLAYTIIGIVVAIIPASLALSLLSYDEGFKSIVDKIFSFNKEDIFYHIMCLVFGIPVGMCIFSLFISCADKKPSKRITKENFVKATDKIKIAPLVTVLAAVIPLLAVYSIFFFSQRQYYISGFTGILPENFSYAHYAREGFFELCKVSVINLAVIILITLMMKKGKVGNISVKILTVVFSAVTLMLIATAAAKLIMYIQYYGLTQKRLYAAWFMAVIAMVFLVITLSRFIRKTSWLPTCTCVVIIAFAGLSLGNIDARIADYNVNRYIDGKLETIDVVALDNLGYASVPAMARLINHMDETNGTDFTDHSLYYYIKKEDSAYNIAAYNLLLEADLINDEYEFGYESTPDIFDYTVNRARAVKALTELGLIKK